MMGNLLKIGLVVLVSYGLNANWDKISGKEANASADLSMSDQQNESNDLPLLSLDEANCWIMDSTIESTGTLTNKTSDFYKGILVEVTLENEFGDSIRSIRMKTQPPKIAGNKTIDFQAMYSIGKMKPAGCRINNVLVLEEDETEYLPIDGY